MSTRNTLYRDRLTILLGLIAISALAWVQTIRMAGDMAMPGMGAFPGLPDLCLSAPGDQGGPAAMSMAPSGMSGHAMMAGPLTLVVMWIVMMIGMMLPAASAMILAFSGVNATKRKQGRPAVATWIFVSGYVVVWSLFSVGAALLQILLQKAALMSHDMALASPTLAAAVLIGAGVYQFTTWKHNCLKHCRSPMSFVMNDWRPGRKGAFLMGFHHGLYCLGCCWLLMLVMFSVGTMNLPLMAMLTFYLLVEKLLPFGQLSARLAGGVMILAGVATLTGHLTWSPM